MSTSLDVVTAPLVVQTTRPATVGARVIRFGAGQTANLLQVEDEAGNVLFAVTPPGTTQHNGPTSSPCAAAQTVTTGYTITLPTGGFHQLLTTGGAVTGVILTAGRFDGDKVELLNNSGNSITFAAAGTSNVADGVSAVIAANTKMSLTWSATAAKWFHGN